MISHHSFSYRVRFIFSLFCFGIVFSGCDHSSKKDESGLKTSNKLYHINILRNNESVLVKKVSDIFTDAQIVPLKIRDNLIIAGIDKIIVWDSLYFILDKNYSTLYCFDQHGEFLRTIGKTGLGPEEFRRIDDFDMDSTGSQILILSNDNLSVFHYDLNTGAFLKQQRIGLFGAQISVVRNNNMLVYVNYNDDAKSNKHNVILVGPDDAILRKYFPFDPQMESYRLSYTGFMEKSNNNVYFCKAFDDTVYIFKNGNFYPHIHFRINSENIRKYGKNHERLMNEKIVLDASTSFLNNIFFENKNYVIFGFQQDRMRKL